MNRAMKLAAVGALALAACLVLGDAAAADPVISMPGVQVNFDKKGGEVSSAIRILLGLTVLSLAPAIMMSMTAFIRIVIVLSMLRHALGMQDTPPNTVIISLALFLTLFTIAIVNWRYSAPFRSEVKESLHIGEAQRPEGEVHLREVIAQERLRRKERRERKKDA